jgi:hypothetical protein
MASSSEKSCRKTRTVQQPQPDDANPNTAESRVKASNVHAPPAQLSVDWLLGGLAAREGRAPYTRHRRSSQWTGLPMADRPTIPVPSPPPPGLEGRGSRPWSNLQCEAISVVAEFMVRMQRQVQGSAAYLQWCVTSSVWWQSSWLAIANPSKQPAGSAAYFQR